MILDQPLLFFTGMHGPKKEIESCTESPAGMQQHCRAVTAGLLYFANYCTRTTSYCRPVAFLRQLRDNAAGVITLLKTLSKETAEGFVRKGFIGEEEKTACAQGLELLLSICVNTALVFAVSAAFHHILSGFFFLLAFVPVRSAAGGYESGSRAKCALVFGGICVLVFTAAALMREETTGQVCLILAAVSAALVYRFAPAAAEDRPMSRRVRESNRFRSMVSACLNLALALILFRLPVLNKWTFGVYFLGAAAGSASMLAVVIGNCMRAAGSGGE